MGRGIVHIGRDNPNSKLYKVFTDNNFNDIMAPYIDRETFTKYYNEYIKKSKRYNGGWKNRKVRRRHNGTL